MRQPERQTTILVLCCEPFGKSGDPTLIPQPTRLGDDVVQLSDGISTAKVECFSAERDRPRPIPARLDKTFPNLFRPPIVQLTGSSKHGIPVAEMMRQRRQR